MAIDSTIRDRFRDSLGPTDASGGIGDPTSPLKEWDWVAFRAGLGLQQAELNELQSVLNYYLKKLGATQFLEGTLLSGATLGPIDPVTREIQASDGLFFFGGKVRRVLGKSLLLDTEGNPIPLKIPDDFKTHYVGLVVQPPQVIDEVGGTTVPGFTQPSVADPDLYDPAQALPNGGFQGAMRVRIYAAWAVDAAPPNQVFQPVWEIPAAIVSPSTGAITQPAPVLVSPLPIDLSLHELEKRTFEWFGQFKLPGLTGAFDCARHYEAPVALLTVAASTGDTQLTVTNRGATAAASPFQPGAEILISMGHTNEELAIVATNYSPQTGPGVVPLAGPLAAAHVANEVVGLRDATRLTLHMEGGIAYVNGVRVQVDTPEPIAFPKALDFLSRTQGVTVIADKPQTYGGLTGALAGTSTPSDNGVNVGYPGGLAAASLSGAAQSTAIGAEQVWAIPSTDVVSQFPIWTELGQGITHTRYLLTSGFLSQDTFEAQTGINTTANPVTVTGIEVRIKRRVIYPRPFYDFGVHLYTGTTVIGENKAAITQAWPSDDFQEQVYGGPDDLWGLDPTQGEMGNALGLWALANVGVALGVNLLSNDKLQDTLAIVDSVRMIVHYKTSDQCARTYQLDQPFVRDINSIEVNMISPMMTFTKAGGVQSLPSVCSVVTTSPEPWAPFVLPNAASPGPASLYSVITYGIDRDGIASATLEIGTGYKTPALAGWDPNVLPGQLDDTVPDPVTHVNQIYVQGTHFTLSGDNITWISGPPDGTTLYVRWIYNTNNGQDGAAPRKGARVRTTVTNAKGTMPATPNAALDVAIPITDANNVPILDVLAINAVTSGPTTYTNGLDYYFDSGRRTDSIVQARLIWRGGGNRPIGNAVFTINLDYWASAGLSSGDYLAASSYAESDGRTLITDRPTLRQADANAWIGSPPDSVTNPNGFLSKLKLAVDIADAIDFRVGNRQPAIGGAMIVAYTYYLPRLDVVALDASGNIQLLLGASAAAPSLPTISPSVLPLLYISSDPASDCPKVRQAPSTVLSIPDLTNMMRRLENLETAALASELEQRGESASDNMIRRGIFSDPFQDFSRADTAFSVVANPSVPAEEGGGNVTFDCAIAPNAQVVRLPFDLQPTQLVVDRPGTSGVWVDGPQLALLTGDTSRSIVQEIRLHQLTPTRAQTINPGNALPPPMVVDLTPAFDFWVDVEQDPEQAVPLTDLGTRAQAPIGAQGAPVVDRGPAAGAAPLLKRRIHRWWNTYHSGQPQSKSDLPLEFAPASHSAIFVDGATGRSVPRASAPNLAAPQGSAPVGFIDSAGRPRQQNSTQAIDTTVVSRDITPLMRQQPIAAHGSLFPPSREVRATFGGAPLALTPVSPTLAGLAPGTVTADVNGEFYATFTVPESSLVGSPQVTFISSVPRRAQGPRGASADQQLQYAGGATEWKAPEHVLDEDDASYSECLLPGGALSQVLMLNGFGFSIPTDANVVGVMARVLHRKVGGQGHGPLRDAIVQLWRGPTLTGAPVGANKARTADDWVDGEFLEVLYGGPNDTWGTTWTPADINANLALGIQVTNAGAIAAAQIASVRVTVYYLAADGSAQEVSSSVAYVARGQLQTATATYDSVSTLPLAAARNDGALAQTFSFKEDYWITELDLFFRTVPDAVASSDNQPAGVEIQIRNTNPGGSPGAQVLGRAVLRHDAIVPTDGLDPTRVSFADPVFVRKNQLHAIVVCTDSDQYSLWVADLGSQNKVGAVVTKSPIFGNVLVANDGVTWRPSANTDLALTMYTTTVTPSASGVLKFQPVSLSPNSGSGLVLLAQQLLPENAGILWEASLDAGVHWVPIQPGVDLAVAQEFTAVTIRATLSCAASGSPQTPAVNLQTVGLLTYVNGGTVVGPETSGNYVSLNYEIPSTFDEVRIVTDEFVPESTTMIPFVSVNDGHEWLALPTEVSRVDLDNGVQEVTRRLNVPAWTPSTDYAVGDVVRSYADTVGHAFKCVVAGTSGGTEPATWATGTQQTTADGGVTWQEVGAWPFQQFRARLRLATTDKSATPQVANLILLALGDAGGVVASSGSGGML